MARRGRPRHPDILTPREWDVLALLREGLPNEEIASRLNITVRTARFHVSEILSKLGVSTRHEAALWRPEERRPLWAAVLGPLALGRKLGLALFAALGTSAVVGTVGLAVLMLSTSERDGLGRASNAVAVEPTPVPRPLWEEVGVSAAVVSRCGDVGTADRYGVPRMLEYGQPDSTVRTLWLGLEAVPYEYVAAQVQRIGGYPWSADGWELSQRPAIPVVRFRPLTPDSHEFFLRRLDEPGLLFRYAAELCEQPDGGEPPTSLLPAGRTLQLPEQLPNVILRREGDHLSPDEVIADFESSADGQRVVWAELGNSHDFVATRNEEIQFPPLWANPEQVLWVVLVDMGDMAGPHRPGESAGYYYRLDAGSGGGLGVGCCIHLVLEQ